MCPRTKILGVDRDGVFAEYVSVPESVVWQNDREKLPPEIATLQEPFGNAVFATLAHDLAGQSVAVLGCGPVGLFSIGIAKASGAFSVLAADINDFPALACEGTWRGQGLQRPRRTRGRTASPTGSSRRTKDSESTSCSK